MRKNLLWTVCLLGLVLIFVGIVMAQESTEEPPAEATEEPPAEATEAMVMEVDAEVIARGEYISRLAGCVSCHTPVKEDYTVAELSVEQRRDISLDYYSTIEFETKLMAGGRVFNLGPAGRVVASNLSPHETGLGDWTDAEIETALRTGVSKDGRRLQNLMPSGTYSRMSAADMHALIAYLRTIPAVENEIPADGPINEAPPVELTEIMPEPPADEVERGNYLVQTVMRCTRCHTPLDPETGRADLTRAFGGGQAYEGAWGIVYGGNITPHDPTGIGAWTDEEIARALRQGVRIDNRRLLLMPWQDYTVLNDDDMSAVIAFLRNLEPQDNEVPLPAVEEAFLQYSEN